MILFLPFPLPPRSTLFPYTTLFRSVLDQLEIELVPTWVRLEAPHSDAVPRPGTVRDLEISGTGLDGQGLFLTGAWLETHRRTGALPKHVIDTEFGPRGL